MERFRQFWEHQQFVETLLREFNAPHLGNVSRPPNPLQVKPKVWSAKKPEIMQMWQNLRSDTPIMITPIDDLSASTESYGKDGIRLTGSMQFITSVLGRIKDLMSQESPQTKLRLVFRGVEPKPDNIPKPMEKPAFVFYLNVERRGQKKSKLTL